MLKIMVDSVACNGKVGRRWFMQVLGVTSASTGLLLTSCREDDDAFVGGVSLGSGDTGVLNYAFALEQLEAAFYTTLLQNPYAGITASETQLLTDIRDHEIAHREFFRAALGSSAITNLEVDFSRVNFGIRQAILETARQFEDLGVSAYNGAGRLLTNRDFVTLAGKIVSVEARHAAYIRALLEPNTAAFAGDDIINNQGLEIQRNPQEVLGIASPFVSTVINAGQLPTT